MAVSKQIMVIFSSPGEPEAAKSQLKVWILVLTPDVVAWCFCLFVCLFLPNPRISPLNSASDGEVRHTPVGTAGAGPQCCQGSRSSGGSRGSGGSGSEVKAEPRDSSVGHTHLPETAPSGRGLSLLGNQAVDSGLVRGWTVLAGCPGPGDPPESCRVVPWRDCSRSSVDFFQQRNTPPSRQGWGKPWPWARRGWASKPPDFKAYKQDVGRQEGHGHGTPAVSKG